MKKRMSVLAGLLILILAVSSVTGCGGQEEKDQENQIIAKETGQEKEEAEKSEVKGKEEGPEAEPEEKEEAAKGMAAPSITGALHVEGIRLMGENQEPVQLRGISTHGMAWFPDYINDA